MIEEGANASAGTSSPRQVRRCRHLLIEPPQRLGLDAAAALAGRLELVVQQGWVARAPHLPAAVQVDRALLDALGSVPADRWVCLATLCERVDAQALELLVGLGLVLGDHAGHRKLLDADERLRAAHWWTPAAVAHAGGCWDGIDASETEPAAGGDIDPPPPAVAERTPTGPAVELPRAVATPLDTLFQQRRTCRNFDPEGRIDLASLAQLMHRVFGAHGHAVLAPGAVALKKGSPSGGGLHPVDAFVLALRVDGLPAGGYHYDCVAHVLTPVADPPRSPGATDALARVFVAGQSWFAEAPVLVILVARFARCQWKYRDHPKAYRVALLDAGHLGQSLALAATERELGCFITAAINEAAIERFFGLASGTEGAVAICGVGPRLSRGDRAELTADGLTGAQ